MHTSSTSSSALNSLFPSDLGSRSRVHHSSGGTRANLLGGTPSATNQSIDPFASQLAEALQGYLSGAGGASGNSPLEIEITPGPSQTIGGGAASRQFIVTVRNGAGQEGSETATPTLLPSSTSPAGPSDATTTGAAASETQTPTVTPPTTFTNEADAYWATQPPAVQVLRTIRNEAERTAKAQELSNQGYAIDVPIMVWNLDPLSIMSVRQAGGMTWIPAMGQNGPETGPGINFPGMRPYDPQNPLPGSLPVTTDWAKGLEHTSPWSIGDDVARL